MHNNAQQAAPVFAGLRNKAVLGGGGGAGLNSHGVGIIVFARGIEQMVGVYKIARAVFVGGRGAVFERARNGEEAVELVNTEAFDLVLMDLKMPVMDGFQATKAIKSLHPSLPVIALTANVFDIDRHNAVEAGCDAFLAKPINREQCLALIKHFTEEEE